MGDMGEDVGEASEGVTEGWLNGFKSDSLQRFTNSIQQSELFLLNSLIETLSNKSKRKTINSRLLYSIQLIAD